MVLGPYKSRNLVLRFPVTKKGQRGFYDVKWISVWCEKFAVSGNLGTSKTFHGTGGHQRGKGASTGQRGTSAGNPCRDNELTLVVRETNFGLILGGQEVGKVSALTCKACSDAGLVGSSCRSQLQNLMTTVSVTERYSHTLSSWSVS